MCHYRDPRGVRQGRLLHFWVWKPGRSGQRLQWWSASWPVFRRRWRCCPRGRCPVLGIIPSVQDLTHHRGAQAMLFRPRTRASAGDISRTIKMTTGMEPVDTVPSSRSYPTPFHTSP